MRHPAGSTVCPIWDQDLHALYMMVQCLKGINKETGSDLLWYIFHENHLDDDTLEWIKTRCKSNLAGPAAERLAIAICDSMLEIPIEQRMMVAYTFSFGVTAKYGYCIYGGRCESCQLHKIREERIDKEEKARYANQISDSAGLSEESGDTAEGH